MVLVKGSLEVDRRILRQPLKDLFVHLRHAFGRLHEAFAVGIFTDAFEDHANALLNLLQIHAGWLPFVALRNGLSVRAARKACSPTGRQAAQRAYTASSSDTGQWSEPMTSL